MGLMYLRPWLQSDPSLPLQGFKGVSVSDENYPYYNGLPPHQAHSETSRAAAIAAIPNAATDRARILDFIRKRGAQGATSDECQAAFGLAHQTGSARVAELLQSGQIIESGRQRKTRRNRNADVLVIAPPGTPPRMINSRYKVPEGFMPEELPMLYRQFRELCVIAFKAGHKLPPELTRLGYWLRQHAGDEAVDLETDP